MTARRTVVGVVRGRVMFPEHPQHEGALGLVGGEDVAARRDSFRSPGEAMTWARQVLDGVVCPRWEAHGQMLAPADPPHWADAEVSCDSEQTWCAEAASRDWRELSGDGLRMLAVVRTDPERPQVQPVRQPS